MVNHFKVQSIILHEKCYLEMGRNLQRFKFLTCKINEFTVFNYFMKLCYENEFINKSVA